jgi:hypothetical protein
MPAERYDERHLQKALKAARTLSVLVQRNTQENQRKNAAAVSAVTASKARVRHVA